MADTGGVFGCHLLGQLKADIEAKFKTGQTQSVVRVSLVAEMTAQYATYNENMKTEEI